MIQGDPKEAVANFKKALKMFKNTAKLHLDMALALDKIGDAEGRDEALKRALELDADLSHDYCKEHGLTLT